ncbi:MAG TPA: DUF5916 domain-containing protein [Longimicrobiales bacterium]|nr:DUF5916 domain-containing protein [Longimicrobiales bacterium]
MLPLLLWILHLAGPPAAGVYSGRDHQLDVAVPRHAAAAEVEVDGRLDDAAWQQAAVLTGFSEYDPADGMPAEDSTEVLVFYTERAIYFGVRAYERHGAVHATLADRDKIWGDDWVHVLLDTYHDGRRALVFGVNPLGVQLDGTLIEGRGDGELDTSPDFIFESKGHVTDYGYEVELRIPFKTLRFPSAGTQDWGIQVLRQPQHSGHQQTWTPAKRAAASFLGQSGTLRGLTGLRRGVVLDLNPVVTSRVDGAAGTDGWAYDRQRPEVGGNVRWGVTSSLTLNGTVNPDFSQVEADVGQVQTDPRQALYFPEKRPFFLDASEQFETPNNLVYTRRIASPVAAAKLAGSVAGTSIGVLSAVDDAALSADGSNPVFNVVRVRRDLGRSTVGLVYTDRIDGSLYNHVAGADARLLWGGLYSSRLQVATSFDRTAEGTFHAPMFDMNVQRNGRTVGLYASLKGFDERFDAGAGFLGRTGVAQLDLQPSYTIYGAPGATLESLSHALLFDFVWDYDEFTAGKHADDLKLHYQLNAALRGGWRLGAQLMLESFHYPEELYRDFYLAVPGPTGVDTVPYTGTRRLPNYDFYVSVTTPRWKNLDASGWAVVGRDENFYEWAPAWIAFMNATLNWRPTDKVRVEGRYIHQQFVRWADLSTVGVQQIPRLKVEYQLSRPVFLRFVGQYLSDRQDDLRDDGRTGLPVLVRTGDGFVRAARREDNGFRADWLFSYQPSPGTVLFLGYGSSMQEPEAFGFRRLARTQDGFFVKLSYLFRM